MHHTRPARLYLPKKLLLSTKQFERECQLDGAVHLILGPWVVDLLALGAENFHCALPGHVAGAHGQAGLTVAQHPGAASKLARLVLFIHGAHASAGEDVAHVDEAIQGLCCALHELVLLVCQDLCAGRVGVEDQIQRIVIVGHLCQE